MKITVEADSLEELQQILARLVGTGRTETETLMDSPLSVLPLHERTISELASRAGIRTIRHLTLKTEDQMRRFLAKHQMSELFEAMEPFGLRLRAVKVDPEADQPFG